MRRTESLTTRKSRSISRPGFSMCSSKAWTYGLLLHGKDYRLSSDPSSLRQRTGMNWHGSVMRRSAHTSKNAERRSMMPAAQPPMSASIFVCFICHQRKSRHGIRRMRPARYQGPSVLASRKPCHVYRSWTPPSNGWRSGRAVDSYPSRRRGAPGSYIPPTSTPNHLSVHLDKLRERSPRSRFHAHRGCRKC